MTTILILLATLRDHARLLALLFVLFALGGIAAAYVKKPVFAASAKLLLNTESLPLSLSRAELPQIGGQVPNVETISTLIEILTARGMIEALVDDLGQDAFRSKPPSNAALRAVLGWVEAASDAVSDGLARLGLITQLSPRDGLVQALRARLVVYPVRQSQVVEVALSWPTPQVPQMATTRLVEMFLARVDGLNALSSEGTLYAQQASQAAIALTAAQTDLRRLQRDHAVVNPTADIARLSDRIARHEQALTTPGAAASDTSPADGSRIDDLLRRISAVQIELAGAAAMQTPQSAAVREISARLAAAEAALAAETARIARTLAEDRARIATLLGLEDRFTAATRRVEAAGDALRAYRQAAADRQVMSLQQERVRIRVIDPPAYPLGATGPSRLVLVVVALIAAAVLAALSTLIWHRWVQDKTAPRRPDGLDGLGLGGVGTDGLAPDRAGTRAHLAAPPAASTQGLTLGSSLGSSLDSGRI